MRTCCERKLELYEETTPAVQLASGALHNELPASADSKYGCAVTALPARSWAATLSKACANVCPPLVMKNGTWFKSAGA